MCGKGSGGGGGGAWFNTWLALLHCIKKIVGVTRGWGFYLWRFQDLPMHAWFSFVTPVFSHSLETIIRPILLATLNCK